MINRETKYPGRFTPGTPQQPEGAFKNRTTNISKDGSYLEKDWLNDWAAFFSSITSEAGAVANDVVDEVGASQIFDAMRKIQTQVTPEVFAEGQNWAGTPYIDPDAVGANPTAKIYPCGTVAGSTDHGIYVKYPDGTLTTRHMESIAITTPSPSGNVFINVAALAPTPVLNVGPYSVTSQSSPTNVAVWGGCFAAGANVQLILFGVSAVSAGFVGYVTVGRWKV